jgi:hypothetical protein
MMTNQTFRFVVGDRVEVIDDYTRFAAGGRARLVCKGVVERVTKCYVFVRNQHNNVVKYHADGRDIGYAAPFLMNRIVPQLLAPKQGSKR